MRLTQEATTQLHERIIALLKEGKSYLEVIKELDTSSATIAIVKKKYSVNAGKFIRYQKEGEIESKITLPVHPEKKIESKIALPVHPEKKIESKIALQPKQEEKKSELFRCNICGGTFKREEIIFTTKVWDSGTKSLYQRCKECQNEKV